MLSGRHLHIMLQVAPVNARRTADARWTELGVALNFGALGAQMSQIDEQSHVRSYIHAISLSLPLPAVA